LKYSMGRFSQEPAERPGLLNPPRIMPPCFPEPDALFVVLGMVTGPRR